MSDTPQSLNQQQIYIRTVDTGFEEKNALDIGQSSLGGQDLCQVLIFRMTLPLEFLLPRSWNHSPLKPDTWKTKRKSYPFLGFPNISSRNVSITQKPRCDACHRHLAPTFKASFNSFGRRLASPGTPLPTWCFGRCFGIQMGVDGCRLFFGGGIDGIYDRLFGTGWKNHENESNKVVILRSGFCPWHVEKI